MKKLHFTLRPAMPEDRNFLYQLKKEVNLGYISAIWGWDEDYQQEEFDRDFQKREEFSVIVSDDADAGFLQLQRGADFLNVAEIHLLPAFRGQGLGTAWSSSSASASPRESAEKQNRPAASYTSM